jgi:adenylate cyclase class IV
VNSNIEVESKFQILDYKESERIRDFFEQKAPLVEAVDVHKRDVYYAPPHLKDGFRFRKDLTCISSDVTICFKHRSRNGGLEVNLEYEMDLGIMQVGLVEKLLGGDLPRGEFTKLKRGTSWHYNGLHVELLSVSGMPFEDEDEWTDLGVWCEIEAVLPAYAAMETERITTAEKEIQKFITDLGFDLSRVSQESYRKAMDRIRK